VVRDEDGKVITVRYEAVNAMLLNEFLKEHQKAAEEHRKVDQQQATITELKSALAQQEKQIQALTATVQKVNNRIELANAAPQLVAKDLTNR
jgi:predicted RNase H-like nuclease (RuvC/YqgF family)